MTTKIDTEQERAELLPCPFCGPGESVVSTYIDDVAQRYRVGCGRCGASTGIHPRDKTEAPAIEAWNRRAALQSQKPKPNDLMLSGVLRMPFDMAMASEISRLQFYHRAQQALDELDALQSQDREDDPLQAAANWLVNAANLTATQLAGNLFIGINRAQRLFDQARRAEGET